MPSILITGSNGFIGSHLVEIAIQQGFKVTAVVRKSSNLKYLKGLSIQYLILDFSNPTLLTQQLLAYKKESGTVDYIVHNAGVTKAKSKSIYLEVNVNYTKNFLNSIKKVGLLKGKFLLISSLAARGPQEILKPVTYYGESKLAAETVVQQANLPYLIFRPTAVYGARDQDFLTLFKTLKSGLELYVGFQTQWLSFIYVKDLTRLVLESLTSDFQGKIYPIAANDFYTTTSFNQTIKQILNIKTITIKLPVLVVRFVAFVTTCIQSLWENYPILNPNKVNELASLDWRCDTTAIERDFNFKAKYPLPLGLKETLNWYKTNGF